MRKISSVILSIGMWLVLGTLPVCAQDNQSNQVATTNAVCEITPLFLEEDSLGRPIFSNFEELKQLVTEFNGNYVNAVYVGDETLIIEEDLEIPSNLSINFSDIIIPKGVTLLTNGGMNVVGLNVEGTLVINTAGGIYVKEVLNITGEVVNNAHIEVLGDSVYKVVGIDKIKYATEQSKMTWQYNSITNYELFKKIVTEAQAETNPHVKYDMILSGDIIVNESIVVPESVYVYMNGTYTVTEAGKVDWHGEAWVENGTWKVLGTLNNAGEIGISSRGVLEVGGTLNNTGFIEIRYSSGGVFRTTSTGINTGNGTYNIFCKEEADIPLAVQGLDVTIYNVSKNDSGYWSYWELKIDTGFEDIQPNAYYEIPVAWAVANGVTNGYTTTTFCPDLVCTRGQIVTFLWRANGSPEPSSLVSQFDDVQDPSAYYYKAVLWAVENGITTGLSATTFGPDGACTRGQVVTFMWRAAAKPASSSSNPFTDLDTNAYYYEPVLWAVENGITTGLTSNTFGPDATCTRGQIVTFLYRGMK